MSGHSKWATIHRAKEANDAKKGAAFTKLAMAITVAVKQGGGIGDPDKNFRLRLAIDKAREFNMPKDNIQRSIDKGTGAAGGEILVEGTYEGFAPGGVALMVDSVSDNKLRTAQQVRLIIEKGGGTFGSTGTVGYLFSHVGELRLNSEKLTDEDELVMIDLGVTDFDILDKEWVVYCDREKVFELKQSLEKAGYQVKSAGLVMKPATLIQVDDETGEKVAKMIDALEDLDDVTAVWSNLG